jgi:hypothetical protein
MCISAAEEQVCKLVVENERLKVMIRHLCRIIEEYPEEDERFQFAMNCLTDIGEMKRDEILDAVKKTICNDRQDVHDYYVDQIERLCLQVM